MPPTSFVLDNWKGLYANEPDKKSIIQNFYDNYDPSGWSIWWFKYDKDEGEGQKLFMFSNLLDMFLNRLEPMRRYSFGVIGIYGDEPDLELCGVLVWRGLDIPQ